MKFLLDVHIAKAIAKVLEAEGHDVVRAALDHATWSDADLLALAVLEERIIVTEDSDFFESDLRVGHAAPTRHHLHPLRAGNATGYGRPSYGHPRIWTAEPPYGRHSSIEQSLSPFTPRE